MPGGVMAAVDRGLEGDQLLQSCRAMCKVTVQEAKIVKNAVNHRCKADAPIGKGMPELLLQDGKQATGAR